MKALKKIILAPHPPILLHEIGKGEEKAASKTLEGLSQLTQVVQMIEPQLIVVITPHGNVFSDGICILNEKEVYGDFSMFGSPEISMSKTLNLEFNQLLEKRLIEEHIDYLLLDNTSAKDYGIQVELDHGTMVPLHFIDKSYTSYQLIHITIGLFSLMELYTVGCIIGDVIESYGQDAVILASGDLSHALSSDGPYCFHPDGPIFDQQVVSALEISDYEALLTMDEQLHENAKACGLRPFVMALGAIDKVESVSKVFSYEGPFGVGYLTGIININTKTIGGLLEKLKIKKINQKQEWFNTEDDYIRLARASIDEWVEHHKKLDWESYKRHLTHESIQRLENNKAGIFVSIHKEKELRGCIGTLQATKKSMADEIISNAISACASDFRFPPVTQNECLDLEIKVDILHDLEPIKSKEELDVKIFGIVVQQGSKMGLLLPNLKGVTTIEQQLAIAKQKAGITSDEDVLIYRFEVERHELV